MRPARVLLIGLLAIVVLVAGCNQPARPPADCPAHASRAIPSSSPLHGYEGPGLTHYDRLKFEFYLGEYYSH